MHPQRRRGTEVASKSASTAVCATTSMRALAVHRTPSCRPALRQRRRSSRDRACRVKASGDCWRGRSLGRSSSESASIVEQGGSNQRQWRPSCGACEESIWRLIEIMRRANENRCLSSEGIEQVRMMAFAERLSWRCCVVAMRSS